MLSQRDTKPSNDQKLEVADIFRRYSEDYLATYSLSFEQNKVMQQIISCRTSAMGGHMYRCNECDHEQNVYNSCRNRHCPKCQTMAKEKWLNDRKAELLPTGYFHFVFTLPHELNPIILCNKKGLLDILFKAVNETLQAFAKDPQWRLQGQLGYIAVLHTWSQTLMDHFHLHCLIPGGVLPPEKDRWVPAHENFLFRVGSLAKAFRNRYIAKLQNIYNHNQLIFPGKTSETGTPDGFSNLLKTLKTKKWIVYAKRPFAGPEKVLEYLGRYTHRVAISNNRIISINDGKVSFAYKDRKENNKTKFMTIEATEFIRRFLLHVLPNRFMKIRYFGFMFHRGRRKNIELIRQLIDPNREYEQKAEGTLQEILLKLAGIDISLCPHCQKGRMMSVAHIAKTAPLKIAFVGAEMNSP